LRTLSNNSELKDFYLVGGTALALHFGHRISIDLVFFTTENFEPKLLFENIKNSLPNHQFEIIGMAENTLNININNIKIDLIRFNYPLIGELFIEDDLRLMAIEDIAAAKLSAVTNRGTKKDFYDIYFLLQKFSTEEILTFFQQKYQMDIAFYHLKSLTYFDDAEFEPNPDMLIDVSWETVKKEIRLKVQELL
jgi:hypothetical protein